MRHLFNAENSEEEAHIVDMVHLTISSLDNLREDTRRAKIGFDMTSALILANLIEIGAAPEQAEIAQQMRETARTYGSVHLAMNKSHAHDLARCIEVGLIRHENGVETPSDFRLH